MSLLLFFASFLYATDATIVTSLGSIEVRLFDTQAPETVKNFTELARGKKEWTKDGKKIKKPLYNETIFHRVIPGFMIQGGDPLGNGTGGPGYQFGDEIHNDDAFDAPGILAMANAGPGTNGSQFFITVAPTPHLKGHHTIFGKVTKGMEIVEKIATVQHDGQDRPITPVIIKQIRIQGKKHAHQPKKI